MIIVDDKVVVLDFPETMSDYVQFELKNQKTICCKQCPDQMDKSMCDLCKSLPKIGFVMNPYDFYLSFYLKYRNAKFQSDLLFTKTFNSGDYIDLDESNIDNIVVDFEKHLKNLILSGSKHRIDIPMEKKIEEGLMSRLYTYFNEDKPDIVVVKTKNELLKETNKYGFTPVNFSHYVDNTMKNRDAYYLPTMKELIATHDSKIFELHGYDV